MSEPARTFAELLRAQRRAMGLTQAELAELAQLTNARSVTWSGGLKTPQRTTLRLLAEAMLETIREFGVEQLAWSGELEPVRRRHAE